MADAGRVIAGSARGVRLAAPGPGTRPLTDRVKQTLFGILEPELDGRRRPRPVRRLRRGRHRGALARGGVARCSWRGTPAPCRVIAENLRRTRLEAAATVVRRDAVAWLAGAAAAAEAGVGDPRFDLVLVDPPYADTASLVRVLEGVGPVVRAGGVVVSKHFWRDAPPAAHRAASIRARAALRRDGADVLPAQRGPEEAGEA